MKLPNIMPYSRLTIALLLSFYTGLLHAEIYRWVDENGVTNYSDKPVKKKTGQTIDGVEIIEFTIIEKAKTAEKPPPAASGKSEVTEGTESKEQLSKNAVQSALGSTEKSANNPDKCRELRQQLAPLEEQGFATYRDEAGKYRVSWGNDGIYTGKREYLSRDEISTKTTELKSQIKQVCAQPDDAVIQADVRADWIRAEHCALNKVILAELKKPDLRTAGRTIKDQEVLVQRYCDKLEKREYRDDENYYPKSFPARRKS